LHSIDWACGAHHPTLELDDFRINELDLKFVEVGKCPCLIERHRRE
jgi:hypothetical protein